jgi:hypothetical protein
VLVRLVLRVGATGDSAPTSSLRRRPTRYRKRQSP